MRKTLKKAHWNPNYPERETVKVEMKKSDLALEFFKQSSTIVCNFQNASLKDPACFWIDKDEVYLRADWKCWYTVSTSDSEKLERLLSSKYCYVSCLTDDNINVKYFYAPIYHIERLPEEVFSDSDPSDEDLLCDLWPEAELSEMFKPARTALDNKVLSDLNGTSLEDINEFKDVFCADLQIMYEPISSRGSADLMLFKDNRVLFLDFLKVVDLEKAIKHIKKLNGMYVPLNMLNPFYDSCVGLVVDDDKLPALMEELKYFDQLHVLITSRGKLKKTLYKVFCTNE